MSDMERDDSWRERLRAAIDADPRSKRAIATAAGLNPAYLYEILSRGQTPTIVTVQAVCGVLGVSVLHVITGHQLDERSERILAAASKLGDADRDLLLNFADRLAGSGGEGDAKDGDGDA